MPWWPLAIHVRMTVARRFFAPVIGALPFALDRCSYLQAWTILYASSVTLVYTSSESGSAMAPTFVFSRHAQEELIRRNIPQALVQSVLQRPQQIVPEQSGRVAYQSQVDFGAGKLFLLRVIVAVTTEPPVVVTVYRTSKIDKYWSNEQ
jgi:hypothetical protein